MKRSAANLDYTKNPDGNPAYTFNTNCFFKMVRSWGATIVGAGDVREGLASEFKHLPVAISLAIAHPPLKDSIIRKGSVIAYTNQFPSIDITLENIQKRIASYLRSLGWKAFVIPPDTDKQDPSFAARLFPLFPHKTGATCSGLGWIGKNGLLITREHGARLSWGTVLTDAPLKVSDKPYLKGECNSCNRCVKVCPAGAIKGLEWSRKNSGELLIDVEKCSQHLTYHKKVIGQAICAHCIAVCPVGKRQDYICNVIIK